MAAFKLKEIVPTERQEHLSLMAWVKRMPFGEYFIHIPNEGRRSVVEGYNLKRMGLKPGVSDFFLAYPSGNYAGIWIELKRKTGVLTALQKEWLKLMDGVGYKAVVAYGWEDAKRQIEEYINLPFGDDVF